MSKRWMTSLLALVAIGALLALTADPGPKTRARSRPKDYTPVADRQRNPAVDPVASLAPLVKGELQALVDGLSELNDQDYIRAKPAAASLAEFLARHLDALPAAMSNLQALDRSGHSFAASILATAIGMVPDMRAAMALLNAIEGLTNLRVRRAAVHALGYNRYGLSRPPGSWTMSTGLVDINTPIKEREVRSGLLGVTRGLLKKKDRASRWLLLDAMAVLRFSIDSDPSIASFMLGLAGRSTDAWHAIREEAVDALSYSRDPAAVKVLQALVAKPPDAELLIRAANGLMRTGTPDNVRRVLAALDRNEKRPIKLALLHSLSSLSPRTKDPAVVAAVEEAIAPYLEENSNPDLQSAALGGANILYGRGGSATVLDRILNLAASAAASVHTRVRALRVLRAKDRDDRIRVRARLWGLVLSVSEDFDVRVAALDSWVRLGRIETLVGDLDQLETLVRQSEGAIRDRAVKASEQIKRRRGAAAK